MSHNKKKGDPHRPSALPCLRIWDGEGENSTNDVWQGTAIIASKKGDRAQCLPSRPPPKKKSGGRALFNTFVRRNSYRFYEPFLFTMQLFKKLHDIRVVIGEKLS